MIDYSKFKKALEHLELQYDNYINIDNSLPLITQEAIKESIVQRFEVCYDCMWKVLKKYLEQNLGLSDVPNSPKPILRIANENLLLSSNIENWIKYANSRSSTSHDYSGTKAQELLELSPSFIKDANSLYIKLST
ncbi:MAG: HI0074 family nucleotidyltransferase substrate-binding subunit [Opitutales bacterium]